MCGKGLNEVRIKRLLVVALVLVRAGVREFEGREEKRGKQIMNVRGDGTGYKL